MWDFCRQNRGSTGFQNPVPLLRSKVSKTYPFLTLPLSTPISSTGKASISYTIPDTITEWKASAFCVEDLFGFGMSAPATLRAFQPFFVDLTLPYSTMRGEDFLLRANVFSYLDHCIQVCISAHILRPHPISKEGAAK